MIDTKNNSSQLLKFHSTDSIINTMVSQSCETTLRMQMAFSHHLDLPRLLVALESTLAEEPILQCRLVVIDKPAWQRIHISANDIFMQTDDKEKYQLFNDEAIDLHNGPLIKCAVLHAPDGDTLFFKISHEIADGDGFIRAVALVARHYNESPNAITSLLQATPRSRSPRQLLDILSWWHYPILLALNLKQKFELLTPPSCLNLSQGSMTNQGKMGHTKAFDPTITDQLRRYARIQNTTLNDVLLTACLRALVTQGNWNRRDALRITMSINLRQYLPDPNQATVCNISSMECLNLGKEPGDSFSETLKKISAATRLKKSNWIGLNALFDFFLQSVTPYPRLKKMHRSVFDTIIKNNNTPFLLTNIGNVKADQFIFDREPYDIEFFAPAVYAPFWNSVAYEYKGQLKLACLMYDGKARLSTLKAFYQEVENELLNAISAAQSEQMRMAPS